MQPPDEPSRGSREESVAGLLPIVFIEARPEAGGGGGRSTGLFSKTIDYTIRAAVCLATVGERPATSQVLADLSGVPARYLSKLLHDLAVARLVRSTPGPHGGFCLARPAPSISVLELIAAVAPLPQHSSSGPGRGVMPPGFAKMRALIEAARARLQDALRRTTLDELLPRRERGTN